MKKSAGSRKKAKPKKAAKKVKKKPIKKAAKKSIFALGRIRRVMPVNKNISVLEASYLYDNVLLITFSNGKKKEVDFSTFFEQPHAPYLTKYRFLKNFKSFKIQEGNVVWGKDWDLIFPVSNLYNNSLNTPK